MAAAREISLAELVRRGLEYILAVSASIPSSEAKGWQLPEPMHLGKTDPFADPDWRLKLYMRDGADDERPTTHGKPGRSVQRARR